MIAFLDMNREDGLVNCSTSDDTFGENSGNSDILNVCYTFKINLKDLNEKKIKFFLLIKINNFRLQSVLEIVQVLGLLV